MGHGLSWFSFFPLYQTWQAQADSHAGYPLCVGEACPLLSYQGWFFGNPVTLQPVFAAILVILVLFVVSAVARVKLNAAGDQAVIPKPEISLVNILDLVLEGLYNKSRQIIGPEAPRYFPVIATLTLFIFFSNILGLFPGFLPPTDNVNTTLACGVFVFLYYNFHGLRKNGMAHIVHLANPAGTPLGWLFSPLMFPVEIASHLSRPFTLGVRLAANMIGDHAVLFAFLGLLPVLVPLPFFALGLMVCMIQTFVFVLLTMVYIGMAVADAHHDEHHADGSHA
jgi:F-type H+-transporting ATPase subunit a